MEVVNLYDAVKRMRQYTKAGVPFEFTYMSYNSTKGTTAGLKKIANAQLRKGYRNDQSDKSQVLIGYVNGYGQNRWFYLPLLLSFNGYTIKP
jgi:hypothetical protein